MIIIFGAGGQIGQALVNYCKTWHHNILTPSKQEIECYTDYQGLSAYIEKHKPESIINLLGYNGGIEFNLKHPEKIYRQTLQLNLNLFQAATLHNVKKVVSALTSCAYPYALDTLKEENLYDGPCHPSVECHGLAKRAVYSYAVQSNKEHGNRFVFTCFNNNYGPSFRFKEPGRLKVCDALIKRFVDAKSEKLASVTMWGDGSARRELLYSHDAASALIFCLEHFNNYELPLLNMGSGIDISIKDLAYLIAKKVGYFGNILWDTTKPNGQMKKLLDVKRATDLGWSPLYDLESGIEKTIVWYEEQLKCTT